MKILVTAPTGKIGQRVLRELLAPEFSVRVIARDPARLPEEVHAQAEVVRGATDDATALRRALDGIEALFWCVPPEPWQTANVRGHYERFARAASQAIREARTPRVVTISAGGKGLAQNAGPISGLHLMEDELNESGAVIRHLRCGAFMENFLGQARSILDEGMFSYPMPGNVPIPMVAANDIADAALRWLARGDWEGIAGVPVHGPRDLSFAQAAATFERILERPVRYREASANRYVKFLLEHGASAEYARSRVNMFAELAQGITRAEPRTAASTTSTTLAEWAGHELGALAESWRSCSTNEPACACTCQT